MSEKTNIDIWDKLSKLKPKKVKLEQVFLDPNNPRFGLGKQVDNKRAIEETVQQNCLEKIKRIGISDLITSIKSCGFSTIDRIVLKPIVDANYIVLEGNRRVAALKLLLRMHETGEETLSDRILNSILEFETLIYEGNEENISWIIQGLRHASGIKEWEAYPKAKFITMMYESGEDPKEIANKFGMKPRAEVMKLIRCYYGFEQAKEDEDWGEQLLPDKFGIFYEIVFKKPTIREWLGWDDNKKKFKNLENLSSFVSLIVPANRKKAKLDISSTSRDIFAELVKPENSYILEKLCDDEKFSIEDASADIRRKTPPEPGALDLPEVSKKLKQFLNFIYTLPIPKIQMQKNKKDSKIIIDTLNNLKDVIEQQLKNIKK